MLGEIFNHANVQALYHMEGTSDSSSNSYTLTDSGTADIAGKLVQARDFELGEGDYMYRTSVANLLITGDASVQFWVKLESATTSMVAVWMGGDGGSETQANNILFYVQFENTGDITVGHEYSTGTNQEHTFDTNLSTGIWYNIFVTRDTATKYYYLYINGVLFNTYNYTNNPDGGSSGQLYIGKAYQTGTVKPFDGILDEVCIWSKTISPSEIRKRYALATGKLI